MDVTRVLFFLGIFTRVWISTQRYQMCVVPISSTVSWFTV